MDTKDTNIDVFNDSDYIQFIMSTTRESINIKKNDLVHYQLNYKKNDIYINNNIDSDCKCKLKYCDNTCIIKYNLSISKGQTDIKQMLIDYLKIINIECCVSNIKLFDSLADCEINLISDLFSNNTKTCLIIIVPIKIDKCNK